MFTSKAFAKSYPDRRYRDRELDSHASVLADQCDLILTKLARTTLGLAAKQVERKMLLQTLSFGAGEAFSLWGTGAKGIVEQTNRWRGFIALGCAALGEWDRVVETAGGGVLSSKVRAASKFDRENTRGLARHLAAIARAGLAPSTARAAMLHLRELFVAGELVPDARVAVLAGRVFFGYIAREPDVPNAVAAWLERGEITFETVARPVQLGDGDDIKVKVFEHYLASLDEKDLAFATTRLATRGTTPSPATDGFALQLVLAGERLPAGWDRRVDPLVARWLGAKVTPAAVRASTAKVQAALDRVHDFGVKHHVRQSDIFDFVMHALHLGERAFVTQVAGAPDTPFVAGKFFNDDPMALLRYLVAAEAAKAAPADVEPAWLEFLSRRTPTSNQRFKGGELRWRHLLVIQHVITERLGRRKPAEVGPALRRTIIGR